MGTPFLEKDLKEITLQKPPLVSFGFIWHREIEVVSEGLVFKTERKERSHSFRSDSKTKTDRRTSISSLKQRKGLLILNI